MFDQTANRPLDHRRAGASGSRGCTAKARLPIHPAFLRLPPPVIVIGMHGSGTSIVSHILAELGAYMGSNLDSHAEAGEFYNLNEELLYRSGAGWQHPAPFLSDLHRPSVADSAAYRLLGATYGQLRTRYLAGMAARPQSTASVWGWKDPRSSLTLPLWLRLFPHARIVHVSRDPAAAASSIHRRALLEAEESVTTSCCQGLAARARWMLLHPPAAARWVGRKAGWLPAFHNEDPCRDAGYCRELADTYLDACNRSRDLGGARLEIRYERLLEQPADAVRSLAAFALGDVTEGRVAAAAALVRRPVRTAPERVGQYGGN